MPYYRCDFFQDGHVVRAEDGEHADDAAALAWASELHRASPEYPDIEVWQGPRLVRKLRSDDA
jgi:hypothetical protein